MIKNYNFAIIIPMANESKEFDLFIGKLQKTLDFVGSGRVYLIVDNASKDNTRELCEKLSVTDNRFTTIWAPENRNVVDAYIRGYKEAEPHHEIIIEMDAGMSHDPAAIPMFLRVLNEGNECAFGSRFINGGSIWQSSFKRSFLSKTGTILSNLLLGTKMKDMTSGYQGFHISVVRQLLKYRLLSKGHFYQTEVRYLMRKLRYMEVPIHYRAPSPSVSLGSIQNSLTVLFHYFLCRLKFKSKSISNE
ncbi:MAG: glycosyltransferase family 2 protein [Tannerella sp.]|nr:glycosyltransferase family 2 protein [Tannerella sp.]